MAQFFKPSSSTNVPAGMLSGFLKMHPALDAAACAVLRFYFYSSSLRTLMSFYPYVVRLPPAGMNHHSGDSAIAHQKIRSAPDDKKRKIFSSTKTDELGERLFRARLDPNLGRPADAQGGVFRHRLMQTRFALFAHDRLQFFRHHQFRRQN